MNNEMINILKDKPLDSIINYGDNLILDSMKIEFAKKIPIIKTIITMIETYQNISDHILIQKLIGFLNGRSELSFDDEIKLINIKKKDYEEFAKLTLFAVDKMDSTKKCEWAGRAWECFRNGLFDINIYKKILFFLNNICITDLEMFRDNTHHSYNSENYIHTGILDFELVKEDDFFKQDDPSRQSVSYSGMWLIIILRNKEKYCTNLKNEDSLSSYFYNLDFKYLK